MEFETVMVLSYFAIPEVLLKLMYLPLLYHFTWKERVMSHSPIDLKNGPSKSIKLFGSEKS